MSSRVLASLALLLCLLAAACSSDSAGGEPFIDPQTDRFSVQAALGQIPAVALANRDTGGELGVEITVVDLDAVVEQAGLTRPTNSQDATQLINFYGPLMTQLGSPEPTLVYVDMPALFRDSLIDPEFEDEYGFVPSDISTFVALDTRTTEFVVMAGVTANASLIERAPGLRIAGAGDGATVRSYVGERDGAVAIGRDSAPVTEWLDGGIEETLADDRVMSNLAMRLDEESVVSAYLSDPPSQIDWPYEAVGLGWAAEDQQPRAVVVFAFRSETEAQEQLAAVTAGFDSLPTELQPGEEYLRVIVDESEVRGSEIVVTLSFPPENSPKAILDLLREARGPFAAQQ